jgi:hypothetical protein
MRELAELLRAKAASIHDSSVSNTLRIIATVIEENEEKKNEVMAHGNSGSGGSVSCGSKVSSFRVFCSRQSRAVKQLFKWDVC